jgi:hypothetical protein
MFMHIPEWLIVSAGIMTSFSFITRVISKKVQETKSLETEVLNFTKRP